MDGEASADDVYKDVERCFYDAMEKVCKVVQYISEFYSS